MLEHGYVTEQQLRKALDMQARERRGRIGEWLQALHCATERQVLTVLGVQWACPLLLLRDEPDTACSSMLPFPLLRALHLFPVRFIAATRLLYIAVSLELNYRILAAIDQIADCRTVPCLVEDGKMQGWLRRAQNQHDVQVFDRSSGAAEMARITSSYVARLSSAEVRIVRCGPYVWARLMGGISETDLLFTTKAMLELGTMGSSGDRPTTCQEGWIGEATSVKSRIPCHPFDSPPLIQAVGSTADRFGR